MSHVNTSALLSAFYKAVAIGGIALFTVGLILATMGPAAHPEQYTEEISATKKLAGSSAYLIDAGGFRYFYLNLSSGESVFGSVTVTSRGQINFYVMNRQHYEAWRIGERPSGIIVQKMMQAYDFSLTPPDDGAYYFVLDNSDSPVPKQVSISEINSTLKQTVTKYRTVYDYTMPILGYSLLLLGAAFTITGLVKKPKFPPLKELKKQPKGLMEYPRLLLPYFFLLAEAVSIFFGSTMVINWLKIEFYHFYSPRVINFIIFSGSIDQYVWLGALFLAFTISYIMLKTFGTTSSELVITSHLTLLISLVLYLTHLQNWVPTFLLIGGFSTVCLSLTHARKLLNMPRLKAIAVFLSGIFSILIPIELGSLIVWIRNSFDPRYPFDLDPRWRIPLIEVQLFNVFYPAVMWMLLALIFSWVWVSFLKAFRRKSKTAEIEPSTPSYGRVKARQLLPKLILLFSVICGIYLTYAPYIYNNRGVRGVDTLWYYQTFDQIKSINDLKSVLFQDPRGFYLGILYVIKLITSQPPLAVVQWTPALLATLLAISAYYLVKTGTKNEFLASLSAVFTTFSFQTTVGMFAGIFANWLAISVTMISLALFLKALEKKSVLYIILAGLSSLLIALIHRWTWGVTIGIFASYALLSLIHFLKKNPDAKMETVFALGVVLINLSPALAVMLIPQLAVHIEMLTASPLFTVTGILVEYIRLSHIVKLEVLSNVAFTLKYYIGGAYNNLPIIILSIIGIAAIRDYTSNFNRALTSWVFIEGIVLSFYGNLPTVWRFLYALPFPVLAAVGLSSINDYVNQRLYPATSDGLSDWICAVTFQTVLTVLTILILFNYAARCIALIY